MANPYFDAANSAWKIKVKEDGTWKSKTLGKGIFAEQVPSDILTLASPYMEQSKAPTAENKPTIDAYCRLYLGRYKQRAGSIRRLVCVLSHFQNFASKFKMQWIEEIGIKAINSFVDYRREQGTADSTIQADLAMLQGMFTMACEETIIALNPVKSPAAKVRAAVANTHANAEDDELSEEIKYYTRAEQAKILQTLDLFALPKYADIVRLMLATGMRINAATNLDFKWITTDHYIRIPKRYDKAKTGYTTFLFGDSVKQIIARRREFLVAGRVFPDVSEGMVYHQLQALYTSKRCPMPDIAKKGSYCHAWRHTFAVNRIEDGLSVEVLQKFMGHHSIKITQRYAKVSMSALHAAVDMIEAKLKNQTIII